MGQGKNLSFFHFSGFIRFRRKPSGIEFLHLATFFFRIGNSVLQRCPKRSADSASRGKKRDFCRGAFKTECGFGLKWESFSRKQRLYVGVSLNGGTPKTPQNDHFLVGKPMVVGYQHFRNPPCIHEFWAVKARCILRQDLTLKIGFFRERDLYHFSNSSEGDSMRYRFKHVFKRLAGMVKFATVIPTRHEFFWQSMLSVFAGMT